MLVYFCPRCLSVEIHYGSLVSPCKDFYYGCPTWTAAVALIDGTPLKGSHLRVIPDRPTEDQ